MKTIIKSIIASAYLLINMSVRDARRPTWNIKLYKRPVRRKVTRDTSFPIVLLLFYLREIELDCCIRKSRKKSSSGFPWCLQTLLPISSLIVLFTNAGHILLKTVWASFVEAFPCHQMSVGSVAAVLNVIRKFCMYCMWGIFVPEILPSSPQSWWIAASD